MSTNSPEMIEKLKNIQLFVLDMDGTIYLGGNPIDGARDFCNKLFENNMLVYFTNNASRAPEDYVTKLTKLGFPAQRKSIVTSGDVTISYLKKYHSGQSVYLVGTPELEKSFTENGIVLSKQSNVVVVSFDLTLTYEKLEHACTLIRNGATFYSTHPDINCPTENGFIPDSGAICAAVTLSTGVKPRYFGKPYAETVEMLELLSGLSRDKIAMVGDRLYTDIALGKKNNMMSILVMTGETTEQDLQKASKAEQPDLIFNSIGDIGKIIFD